MKNTEIVIRDPFVLPVPEEKTYYLFGSTQRFDDTQTDEECLYPEQGFYYYKSSDLENWKGPYPAFIPGPLFWGKQDFWAPEVHEYQGCYYMFASFKSDKHCRATHILISTAPGGPYVPLADKPVTPDGWECLDGTLYKEENEAGEWEPWIVFCHEWVQTGNGTINARRLTNDLKAPVGDAVELFSASDAPWCVPFENDKYVTDGPFLFRQNEKLCMLWSSFGKDGYAMAIAESATGKITGPWIQREKPFFSKNGGHGMFFRKFDGTLMYSLHQPNSFPEHPYFFECPETF